MLMLRLDETKDCHVNQKIVLCKKKMWCNLIISPKEIEVGNGNCLKLTLY